MIKVRNIFVSRLMSYVSRFIFKRLKYNLRCTAVFIILFACFPLLGCFAQQEIQKQADLTQKKEEAPDPNIWDFGQVKEGEILKHTFVLKNESSRILNIKEVHTSCGCTTSEVKKRKLMPAESTEIKVEFNTKGYPGKTQKYIYVNVDNLEKPVIRFVIKADVVK